MAADLCAMALGTDSGGSVRQPAGLCGVAGYKCTPGMWSTDGVFPLSFILDSLGIFAKTAADIEYAFGALCDTEPRAVSLRGFRIGIPRRRFFEDLEKGVEERIDQALQTLARGGAELVELDLPEVADTDEMFARIVPTELAAFLGEKRIAAEGHLIDPVVRARLEGATGLKANEYLRLVWRHAAAVRSAAARLEGLDGWLSPTTPLVAIPVAEASTVESAVAWNQRSMRNTRPVNYLGQCGISIPLPAPAPSLPVGLQLAAAPSKDAHLLAMATAMERALA